MRKLQIDYISDLHIEFFKKGLSFPDMRDDETGTVGDILVMAGDMFVAKYLDENRTDRQSTIQRELHHSFMRYVTELYDHVLFIAGNHEYYGSTIENGTRLLEEFCAEHEVTFLNNETVSIRGVTFIGTTLWTDYNNKDPLAMHSAGSGMNDYRNIFWEKGTRICPESIYSVYKENEMFLRNEIQRTTDKETYQRIVVITHHAPSWKCNDRQVGPLTSSFYAHLDYMMEDPEWAGNTEAWIYGHTHAKYNKIHGKVNVVSNPHGYMGYESVAAKWKPESITV